MQDNVIPFERLQELTGLRQPAAIARRLKRQGVSVIYGKGGVFTTEAALNAALGVAQNEEKQPEKITLL